MIGSPSDYTVEAELGIATPLPEATFQDQNEPFLPVHGFSLTSPDFLDVSQSEELSDGITRTEFSSLTVLPHRPDSSKKEQFVSVQSMPLPSNPPREDHDEGNRLKSADAVSRSFGTLGFDSAANFQSTRTDCGHGMLRSQSDEISNNFVFHRLDSTQRDADGKAFGGKLIFPLLRLTEQSTPVHEVSHPVDLRFPSSGRELARDTARDYRDEDVRDSAKQRRGQGDAESAPPKMRRALSGLSFARKKTAQFERYSSFERATSGDGSEPRTRRNGDFEDRNEEEEEEEASSKRSMIWLYVHVGLVIAIALYDAVAALVLQVFWVPGDSLCTRPLNQPHKVRAANAVALACILLAHIVYLLSRMLHHDSSGKRFMFQIFHTSKTSTRTFAFINVMYVAVVFASVTLLGLSASMCTQREANDSGYAITRRLHLAVHLLRLLFCAHNVVYLGKDLRRRLQTIVSVNKRRFIDAELSLDLDLTYIADRLIAFALPCVENAFYRNDIRMVARFFAARHYGSFVVTNLCEAFEEGGNGNYDTALLYSQVQKLPMRDHNAPDLLVLVSFCEKAASWLNARRKNVVAVHCQGGKGRTGTFCSALMLWVGFMTTAEEAAEYFARRRTKPVGPTDPLEGINAPCQHRYLKYIETMMYQGVDVYARHSVLLHSVTIYTMPYYHRERVLLSVVIETAQGKVWDSCKEDGPLCWLAENESEAMVVPIGPLYVQDDVTVRIFLLPDQDLPLGVAGTVGRGGKTIKYNGVKGKCISFVTVNTAFHARDYLLAKDQIDEAYKDRRHHRFSDEYSILLGLTDCTYAEAIRLDGLQTHRKSSMATPAAAASPSGSKKMTARMMSGLHGAAAGKKMLKALGDSLSSLQNASFGSQGSYAAHHSQALPKPDGASTISLDHRISPIPSASEASLAHSEGALAENLPRLPTVRAQEGIVPGLTGGVRELALTEAFGEVLAKVCPHFAVFHKGDVILDVRDKFNPPLLMYVVQGQVSCVSLWDRRALGHCALGMHRDQRDNEVIGVGEVFAVRETAVRKGRNTHQVVYRAKSSVVKLRVLRAGYVSGDMAGRTLSTSAGPFAYPSISTLSSVEKCIVHEFVARYATNLTHRLSKMQLDVTSVVKSKHDRKAVHGLDFKHKLVASVIAKHNLPVIEMAIASQECTRIDKGKKTDGHLILLNHWLLFVPLVSTGQRDLVVPLQEIVATDGNREHVFIASKARNHRHSTSSEPPDLGKSIYGKARKGMTRLRSGLNLGPDGATSESKHSSCAISNSGDTDSGSAYEHLQSQPMADQRRESSAGVGASLFGASESVIQQPGSMDSLAAGEAYRVRNERKRRLSLAIETTMMNMEGSHHSLSAPSPQHQHSHRISTDDSSNMSAGGGGVGFPLMAQGDDEFTKLHFVLKSNGLGHLFRNTVRLQVGLVEEEYTNLDTFQPDLDGILSHYGYLLPEEDSLGERELTCLRRMLSEDKRKFKAGEVLIKRGEDCPAYMHILEGTLTVRSDDDAVLAIRTKGDSVMESNFLAAGNRGSSAKVIAETELVVQCVSFDSVEKMAHQVPIVGACIFRALGRSLLRRSHRQTVQLLAGEQHITAAGGNDSGDNEISRTPSR